MKKMVPTITILIVTLCIRLGNASVESFIPDFGQDGTAGLTDSQKFDLSKGKIVFFADDKSDHCSLIEAAIVFNKSPEEVWEMLSKTEDQIKYLKEIKRIDVIERNADSDTLRYQLKVMLMPVRYQIIHYYSKDNMYFYWLLDPSYKGDVSELKGYWMLYPCGAGKTLARYGSLVTLKHFPFWMQEAFKKKAVGKALESMRCYIDSGGTCKRRGY